MLVFSITVPVYGSSRTVSFTLNNLFILESYVFILLKRFFSYRTNDECDFRGHTRFVSMVFTTHS